MLYVIVHRNNERTWHVGDKKFPVDHTEVADVMEIQADGHELEVIKTSITGIPTSNRAVVNWYGDDAKFIAGVLKQIGG